MADKDLIINVGAKDNASAVLMKAEAHVVALHKRLAAFKVEKFDEKMLDRKGAFMRNLEMLDKPGVLSNAKKAGENIGKSAGEGLRQGFGRDVDTAFAFAKVGVAIRGVTAGIQIATAGIELFRGNANKAAEIFERLPFGIGHVVKEARILVDVLNGFDAAKFERAFKLREAASAFNKESQKLSEQTIEEMRLGMQEAELDPIAVQRDRFRAGMEKRINAAVEQGLDLKASPETRRLAQEAQKTMTEFMSMVLKDFDIRLGDEFRAEQKARVDALNAAADAEEEKLFAFNKRRLDPSLLDDSIQEAVEAAVEPAGPSRSPSLVEGRFLTGPAAGGTDNELRTISREVTEARRVNERILRVLENGEPIIVGAGLRRN